MRKTFAEAEAALRDLALRWMEAGWQRGDANAVLALHAPDFIDHDAAGRAPDNSGFRAGILELYAAFPDFYTQVEDLVIEARSGKVAIRWTASGSHRGAFLGFPATGRRIHFQGIEILRIASGRVADRWGEWDGIGLLSQLRTQKEAYP